MADYRNRNKIFTLKGQNNDFTIYWAKACPRVDESWEEKESPLTTSDVSTTNNDSSQYVSEYMHNSPFDEKNYKCIKHHEDMSDFITPLWIGHPPMSDSYINTFSGPSTDFNNNTNSKINTQNFTPPISIPDNQYLKYKDVLFYQIGNSSDHYSNHGSRSTIMYLSYNPLMPGGNSSGSSDYVTKTFYLGSQTNYTNNAIGWDNLWLKYFHSTSYDCITYNWQFYRSYYVVVYKVKCYKSGQLIDTYPYTTSWSSYKGSINDIYSYDDDTFKTRFITAIRTATNLWRTKYSSYLGGITSSEFSISYFTTQFNNIDTSDHYGFYMDSGNAPIMGLRLLLNTSSISSTYDSLVVTYAILPKDISIRPINYEYYEYDAKYEFVNIPDYPYLCVNWDRVYHGLSNLTINHNYCEDISIPIDEIRSGFPLSFIVYRYDNDLQFESSLRSKTITTPSNLTEFNFLIKNTNGNNTYYYFEQPY